MNSVMLFLLSFAVFASLCSLLSAGRYVCACVCVYVRGEGLFVWVCVSGL